MARPRIPNPLSWKIMVRFNPGMRAVIEEAARKAGCATHTEWVRKIVFREIEKVLGVQPKNTDDLGF